MSDRSFKLSADGRLGIAVYDASAKLLPPFEAVRLKIQRARAHIAALEGLLAAYQRDAEPQWNRWWEPHYEHMEAWWLSWNTPTPPEIPLMIGDAAHNLRASLDILVCDMARANGRGVADLKFPFAENAKAWRNACAAKELTRIGPEALTLMTNLEAYRGGPNSGLRVIHDLDVLDKHRLIVPTFAGCWAIIPDWLRAQVSIERVRGVQVVISDEDTFLVRKGLATTLLPKPSTGAIAHFPYGLTQIAAIAGQPVVETLTEMANYVDSTAEAFISLFD